MARRKISMAAKLLTFIISALGLVSCGSARKSVPAQVPVSDPVPVSGDIRKPDVSLNKLIFSANLLKEAYSQDRKGNIILSPYSAGAAFSMLAEGAGPSTRKALSVALSGASYYGDFPISDSSNIVKSAGSLWLNRGFRAKDKFVGTLRNGYAAEVFSAESGDAVTPYAVNAWCGRHTAGLIDHIIDRIAPETKALLLNALYFKAQWAESFSRGNTYEGQFYGSEDGHCMVDFMHKTSRSFGYMLTPGCKFVNLEYRNGLYAMLIAVPDDMDAAMEKLGPMAFQDVLSGLKKGRVSLSLPKFKIETSLVLNAIMSRLGAGEAFSGSADFSGISDENLSVSSAIQKCVVEVSEEGTEAAAVTSVRVGVTALPPQEPTVRIDVNKPFLFAIYNIRTQEILFEGKIADVR